uniref:Cytochrome c oxidase subunit 3 n=1 Tax=Lamellodiscus spari TaxID=330065 RepID=A0A346Q030_9PLAT|nr:cytochrome c oxidase subunit 3 [Lamellodiscus spari]
MNWLPVYNAILISIFIVSLFLWKLVGFFWGSLLLLLSLVYIFQENVITFKHYLDAFYMFLLSEVLLFFSLLFGCIYFSEDFKLCLSHYLEIPLLGTALLLTSSLTASVYHSSLISLNIYKKIILGLTLVLGGLFMVLQGFEFNECIWNFSSSSYYGCCFSVICLHLSHVMIGLILLCFLFLQIKGSLSNYYGDLIVIYWHFVDYIWLLVYLVAYII